ncbi:MAG: hypothetical protein JNM43_00120 [Planctomycetaceae bacterium]|nr:hypothetical protein [Planctomycetaceae bacterium]
MEDTPENYPLVERFHKAEYLARELTEHLQQSFLPKLSELRHASKVYDPASVSDQEMLDRMTALMASEDFANGVFDKLLKYLRSIEAETKQIMGVKE